jgi:activating signal cointegrator 1
MKALSLWQPWAQGIVLGLKSIETRSWFTSYRGPLLIHAAKRWTEEEAAAQAFLAEKALSLLGYDHAAAIAMGIEGRPPLGAVVALAELDDCFNTEPMVRHGVVDELELAFGDFRPGRYGWCLGDVRPLPEPIPWPGKQGLWDAPRDLQALVKAALAGRKPIRFASAGPSLSAPAAQGLLFDPAGGAGPYGGGL